MPTYHVTLIVDGSHDGVSTLPVPPVGRRRRPDGDWDLDFEIEGESFDRAAGRLWGEAAACGVPVLGVAADRPLV